MQFIRNLPIRRKLMLITMIISGVALIVACAAFAAYDYIGFRKLLVKELITSADVIGANSTAAISFGDRDAAKELLSSLRADPTVMVADIDGPNNADFTAYCRQDIVESPVLDQIEPDTFSFRPDSLIVSRTIWLAGKSIGTIRIQTDLSRLHQRIRSYATAMLLVLAAGLAASLVVSSRLQGLISLPILELTQIARQIAEKRNYASRAVKTSNDELGTLIDCFNEMLKQIELRDVELASHRDNLEAEVARRTDELRSTNTQLTTARDRAEEANRAKTAFLANMSHEIRTPMNAILGYADLMLTPSQTMSDRINSLQVVRRNARHLMDLINDILDISKIEAEKMTVEKIAADVAQITLEVASMLRPKALAKNLMLVIEFDGPIPAEIKTDPLRLKQVLMNLTGNAIKFTERGEVRLKVSVEQSPGGSRARFDICDSGIGLNPRQIDKLFQPFVQADESMTRKYGGTGLGLVISKRLATYLGGDLSVQSEFGKGSTFSFWIDGGSLEGITMREGLCESLLSVSNLTPAEEDITVEGRILLAEDGMDNQQLLSLHLTTAGAQVVVAENGLIALNAVKSQKFDLVLMDMQMPELDGYGATSELRRLGYDLPIIALTAHAMAGDRARCINAGCTDYLTKPIDKELLLRTVSSYLRKARLPSQQVSMPQPVAAPPPLPSAVPAPVSTQAANPGQSKPIARANAADAMRRAVEGFVGRLPGRVDELAALSAAHELDKLRTLVHQLKGAGTGYGFPAITQTAARTEAVLKGDSQFDAVHTAVEELIALIRGIAGYDPTKERQSIPQKQ
jgi:signal transduction histidine kinase/ActR/RegA family two-component response regulator/HPt (histidine-containing phosphotransfer) domain-containing protein